jgi:hypothetical protein
LFRPFQIRLDRDGGVRPKNPGDSPFLTEKQKDTLAGMGGSEGCGLSQINAAGSD